MVLIGALTVISPMPSSSPTCLFNGPETTNDGLCWTHADRVNAELVPFVA
jgi:hypothetical protein